jgi:sigma-B regulation protein RsbU (phosphoserine phosphatase)
MPGTRPPSWFDLGLAIAAGPGARYAAEQVVLDEGDTLVLYTDGLTEAVNSREEEYGHERLLKVLASGRRHAPRELIAECLSDLSSFLAGASLSDDLTMLALTRR